MPAVPRLPLAGAVVLTVAAVAIPAAPAAAQSTAAPALSIPGFSLERSGKRVTLNVAPAGRATFRKVAGQRAVLLCQPVRETTDRFLVTTAGSLSTRTFRFAMPRKLQSIVVARNVTGTLDACELAVTRKTKGGKTRVALDGLLNLTDLGAQYISELGLAARMNAVLALIGETAKAAPGQAYPTTDAVVAAAAKIKLIGAIEALPDREAVPTTPGAIGVWTDGANQAVAAAVTDNGRRIFLDATGDALSSNSPVALGGG